MVSISNRCISLGANKTTKEEEMMNIEFVDGLIMPIITAGALCIGYVMKKWLPTDDKWIPTVLLILGALSGLILFGVEYEGIVKGMVSGLAAVGLHQVFKQQLQLDEPHELTEEEVEMWMNEADDKESAWLDEAPDLKDEEEDNE